MVNTIFFIKPYKTSEFGHCMSPDFGGKKKRNGILQLFILQGQIKKKEKKVPTTIPESRTTKSRKQCHFAFL